MLLRFLVHYADDPELRSRFARNPGEVLDEYQVSPEDRELFKPLDLGKIEKRMTEQVPEVLRWVVDQILEDFAPLRDIYGLQVPAPSSIEPQSGPTGQEISFTISGSNFDNLIAVHFSRPLHEVHARDVSVNKEGTVLQGSATFLHAGEYDVVVDNLFFIRGSLPFGFTAT